MERKRPLKQERTGTSGINNEEKDSGNFAHTGQIEYKMADENSKLPNEFV